MLLPHPELLSILAESRLESVRRDAGRIGEGPGLRRRVAGWLLSAGFKLAPDLRPASSRSPGAG